MTTGDAVSVIIGSADDPHTVAVRDRVVARGVPVEVLDAANADRARWRWVSPGKLQFCAGRGWQDARRGWLRRLAPPGWHAGVELGTRRAAEAGAWLALLGALTESGMPWLSSYWAVTRAENKLVQYAAAAEQGIRVPASAVAARPEDLPIELGDPLVLKPLGVGEFVEDEIAHAVYARAVERTDPALVELVDAPFIAQRRIDASEHLRVVTVGHDVWSCRLEAEGLPIDWRRSDSAHSSWQPASSPSIENDAQRLAVRLKLGYSSQDWILDGDGVAWLVDVNPAGQWLFLPMPVATEVTNAIADWLADT